MFINVDKLPSPAIVVVLSPFFFNEKLSFPKICSLGLALIGAIFITYENLQFNKNIEGLIIAFLSAFAYAIMVISNKKSSQIRGLENCTIQLIATLITVLIFSLITNNYNFKVEYHNVIPIIWLGIINTGVCCYLYFSAMAKLQSQTIAICGYIEPLSAVLLATLVLHEYLTTEQIIGTALIIFGALYSELKIGYGGKCN